LEYIMRKQISLVEYSEFYGKYMAGFYSYQRLGQAFYNYVAGCDGGPHAQLFYETDNIKAIEIIEKEYLRGNH
jgi:hypothetical protein